MRKRLTALGLAALLAVSSCFTAMAENTSEGKGWKRGENGRWMFMDAHNKPVSSTIRRNMVKDKDGNPLTMWFWLEDDGYLAEDDRAGDIVSLENVLFFRLREGGRVETLGWNEDGWEYDLAEGKFTGNKIAERTRWRSVKDKDYDAWTYLDENDEPVKPGVYEIDGHSYYFDEDGEIKWKQSRRIVGDYYINGTNDASIAVNRWIPYGGEWYYFGEDGKKVSGVQEIDGTQYRFDADGRLVSPAVSFPEIESITLDTEQTKAEVGDTVEIPFTIMVASASNAASPSNATEPVEADYDLFKNAYAVEYGYRANVGDFNTSYVPGESHLRFAVETKYDIDWDNQVIRVPIQYRGAVFGNLRIGNVKSNSFGITCDYSNSAPAKIKLNQLLKLGYNSEDSVKALKGMDKKELKTELLDSDEAISGIRALEWSNNDLNGVESYVSLKTSRVAEAEAVGLGFSAGKNASISLNIGESTETLPADLKAYHTVPLDLSVLVNGTEKKTSLEVPAVITMKKPRGLQKDSFELYHIQNGQAEVVPYVLVDEETVKFVADRFSTYVFAEEKTANNGGSTSSGGSGDSSDYDYTASSGASASDKKPAAGWRESLEQGQWKQNATGWWFERGDGSYPVSIWKFLAYQNVGGWYHFDENGYMETGWFHDTDGSWYYLNPVSDGTKGRMLTGWQYINGYWYYLNETAEGTFGKLLTNTVTPDGYPVDAEGRWTP